ncbi:lipopolysaccharide-induced tumor necrosis factor-alpha factor homolog [Nannochloropsis oceanica]
MPGGGGGPYPPPKVAVAHAVAEPVQASYDNNYDEPSFQQHQRPYDQQGGAPITAEPVPYGQQHYQQGRPQQVLVAAVNPRLPMHIQCPRCGQAVTTIVRSQVNGCTFLGCFCFLMLGMLPCALLPFCIPSCQGVVHICPACRYAIAAS